MVVIIATVIVTMVTGTIPICVTIIRNIIPPRPPPNESLELQPRSRCPAAARRAPSSDNRHSSWEPKPGRPGVTRGFPEKKDVLREHSCQLQRAYMRVLFFFGRLLHQRSTWRYKILTPE